MRKYLAPLLFIMFFSPIVLSLNPPSGLTSSVYVEEIRWEWNSQCTPSDVYFEFSDGTSPDISCPPGWTYNEGSCYRSVPIEYWGRFESVRNYCNNQGGHIIAINSQGEDEYYSQTFRDYGWMGASRILYDCDFKWKWDSGEPIVYQRWRSNPTNLEPNCVFKSGNNWYAIHDRPGDDDSCANNWGFACEITLNQNTRVDSYWTSDGLVPNTPYTFNVRARTIGGDISSYSSLTSTTQIESPIGIEFGAVTWDSIQAKARGTFTNLGLGQSATRIRLGINGIESPWSSTNVFYNFTGLTENTEYCFYPTSRNQVGNGGDYYESNKQCTRTPFRPADTPSNLRADSTTANSITWSWQSGGWQAGFYIFSPDNGTTTSTSWVSSGLKPDTEYEVRLKAYNNNASKQYSEEISMRAKTNASVTTLEIYERDIDHIKLKLVSNNPSHTLISIKDILSNKYVQSDGTLGSSEFKLSKGEWGSIVPVSVRPNTRYIFVAVVHSLNGNRIIGNELSVLSRIEKPVRIEMIPSDINITMRSINTFNTFQFTNLDLGNSKIRFFPYVLLGSELGQISPDLERNEWIASAQPNRNYCYISSSFNQDAEEQVMNSYNCIQTLASPVTALSITARSVVKNTTGLSGLDNTVNISGLIKSNIFVGDFENGELAPFYTYGVKPWTIDSGFTGQRGAKSGIVSNGEYSVIELDRNLSYGGSITFSYFMKIPHGGSFKLYINGEEKLSKWGNSAIWDTVTIPLLPNQNSFKWVVNSGSGSGNSYALIDDVIITSNVPV